MREGERGIEEERREGRGGGGGEKGGEGGGERGWERRRSSEECNFNHKSALNSNCEGYTHKPQLVWIQLEG